jgi:hypothetical protein
VTWSLMPGSARWICCILSGVWRVKSVSCIDEQFVTRGEGNDAAPQPAQPAIRVR